MNFVNSSKKERKKKEENRILSRLEREATKKEFLHFKIQNMKCQGTATQPNYNSANKTKNGFKDVFKSDGVIFFDQCYITEHTYEFSFRLYFHQKEIQQEKKVL